ncbi:MAG: DEAD/DEAH box helicase family protein [Bacteroides sp.]
MAQKTTISTKGVKAELRNSLLLHRFMLNLLGVRQLDRLTDMLCGSDSEGNSLDGGTKFCTLLSHHITEASRITLDQLQEYDRNIVQHTEEINQGRTDKVRWKHFQYLELLMMEIYLDRYFRDADALAKEITRYCDTFFCQMPEGNYTQPFRGKKVTAEELRKVAVWCATGSGKTLMMHVNLRQVLHYAQKYHRKDFDNMLLVTPKEGLSRQHIEELKMSGFSPLAFNKSNQAWTTRDCVQVIEVTKLKDENGPTTVDVAAFGENNFVLVDEAHNAQGGDTQKPFRDRLSLRGFCIEYSATLGQAVDNANGTDNKLLREYGVSTIFDYSYRHFYHEGYGKEFETCNINAEPDDPNMFIYEVGGLMGFYEQQLLFTENQEAVAPLLIARPLAIFIGHTVSASDASQEVKELMSDVVRVVKMLARVMYNKGGETVTAIDSLLKDGCANADGRDVFENYFAYLKSKKLKAQMIYDGMMKLLFNGYTAGSGLVLDNMRGVEGEIALYTAHNEHRPFGVINVGKPADVVKACQDFAEIRATDFTGGMSRFDAVNDDNSTVNLLIGAKKFTEGWSSWRVSTMCLMNVGKSKGSEIIQLFGRGVRLKGVGFSLKRTNALMPEQLPEGLPEHVEVLETLRIFGMDSKYVSRFEEEIKKEEIKPETITISIKPTFTDIEAKKLSHLREPADVTKKFFTDHPRIDLDYNNDYQFSLTLDQYPNVYHNSSNATDEVENEHTTIRKNSIKFKNDADRYREIRLINKYHLWLELREYKLHEQFYNIYISYEKMVELLWMNDAWYTLYASDEYLRSGSLQQRVNRWQELALSLLKMYLKAFFTFHKRLWLSKNTKVDKLKKEDVMHDKEYRLQVHPEQDTEFLSRQLRKVQEQLENDVVKNPEVPILPLKFNALFFDRHLYQPLLSYPLKAGEKQKIPVSPVPLNQSETDFLKALMKYCNQEHQELAGCELYLLRNKSKQGTGFFTNAGFYPDFIMWIVRGRQQWITFIEPHGMLHEKGDVLSCDKVKLAHTINEIEDVKRHKNLTLNSYIITPTPIKRIWPSIAPKNDQAEALRILHDNHLYASEEGMDNVVKMIIQDILKIFAW